MSTPIHHDYSLLVESIRKFVPLSEDESIQLSQFVVERTFSRNQFINSEGEINRYTNFITKGSARVYYIDHAGDEHIIQLGIRGWWLGDYPSFITQQPGMLYTEALEPLTALSISYPQLQESFEVIPKMERFYRLLIQRAYASFQNRVLQSLSMDAEQRYVMFKNAYPDMDLQISQKHIASYLGMSAEFLSKIKKRLVVRERSKRKIV